jgi:ketosteroid isomerase-like protein
MLRRFALRFARAAPWALAAVLRRPLSSWLRRRVVPRYVRWGYAAINDGHERAALSLLDPDIEVRDPPQLPDGSVYHGHAGLLENLAKFREIWTYSYDVTDIQDAGQWLLISFRAPFGSKLAGIPLEEEWAHLWTVRDGRLMRLEWFLTVDDARVAMRSAGAAASRPPRQSSQV